MIRDIIVWTKAYLLAVVVIIPIVIMFVTPLIVLIEGQALRIEMLWTLFMVECSTTLIWLLTITGVVVKCCYKKIKERL